MMMPHDFGRSSRLLVSVDRQLIPPAYVFVSHREQTPSNRQQYTNEYINEK